MTTKDRINTVEQHLRDFEYEGRKLREEIETIGKIRRRVKREVIALSFGAITRDGKAVEFPNDFNRIGYVVLGDPERVAALSVAEAGAAPNCVRASEIAGPGLRACLEMWLNEWESRANKALAAWEARDPIAEAVEKSKAVAVTAPAAPPAVS